MLFFFFFNDPATTESYTLSLHDALPIAAAGPANTLAGSAADTTWTVTAANAGTVGTLSFNGFQLLVGAANNKDTFILRGGSVTGIDGGAGGFDSLIIDGAHASVSTAATGPSSGTVTVDGTSLAYAGLEPITLAGTVTDVNVTGGSGDDDIVIHHDPVNAGQIEVKSTTGTIESVHFAPPTGSLTVDGAAGKDTVTVAE